MLHYKLIGKNELSSCKSFIEENVVFLISEINQNLIIEMNYLLYLPNIPEPKKYMDKCS